MSKIESIDKDNLEEILDFSATQLNEAYSRMQMATNPWTKHTVHEINWILRQTQAPERSTVLDIGCGQGRHTNELTSSGYKVLGIDISKTLIENAEESWYAKWGVSMRPPKFLCADARNLPIIKQFNLVLCLYDVIGSYRTAEENRLILQTIHRLLKKGGRAVISVMNLEFTRSIATNIQNVRENLDSLISLPASNRMQKTGNIFNPKYFILDEEAHLVYRKEQFDEDEFIIADYRYTKAEIEAECETVGLKVISSSYVQAGRWNTPLAATDRKAKEILLVVEM